ncbi:MAG TPA: WG repeat-containing protein, partial [Saprospiraceae bacterium]|nr:WG repeat-containing protein [Saprospiraceae bacterium]
NTTPTIPTEEDYGPSREKWGFMDRNGRLSIKGNYDEVRGFVQGRAAVRKKGRWGYIDNRARWIAEPQFRAAWSFSEGLARVTTFEDKAGFIDTNGDWAIQPTYADAGDFRFGRARAM